MNKVRLINDTDNTNNFLIVQFCCRSTHKFALSFIAAGKGLILSRLSKSVFGWVFHGFLLKEKHTYAYNSGAADTGLVRMTTPITLSGLTVAWKKKSVVLFWYHVYFRREHTTNVGTSIIPSAALQVTAGCLGLVLGESACSCKKRESQYKGREGTREHLIKGWACWKWLSLLRLIHREAVILL